MYMYSSWKYTVSPYCKIILQQSNIGWTLLTLMYKNIGLPLYIELAIQYTWDIVCFHNNLTLIYKVVLSASGPITCSFSFTVQLLRISISGFLSSVGISRLVDSKDRDNVTGEYLALLVLSLLGRRIWMT